MRSTMLPLGVVFLAVASTCGADAVDWPALIQKPHAKLPLPELGLRPLPQATTEKQWAAARQDLHGKWLEHLGKAPAVPNDLDVETESVEQREGYKRHLLSFHSADGDHTLAYLLVPDDIKQGEKRPAVVVFHQTTNETLREPAGLGKNATLAVGLHLVKRGYVVLCPQCFIMKEGGPRAQATAIAKRWPGWTGLGKMTFDASRCVDFLESLAYVDRARIGCIGHSLGAKETLYAMAFEPRYRVGVFNEGGVGLRMSNWTDPWYFTDKMKPHIPAFEHHQVLALVAPRPILILGGDSADGDASWPFIHAVLPVYQLLNAGERVGLVNHHGKHSFPRDARQISYRWIDHWLEFTPKIAEVGP